jgi:hypothetical protein
MLSYRHKQWIHLCALRVLIYALAVFLHTGRDISIRIHRKPLARCPEPACATENYKEVSLYDLCSPMSIVSVLPVTGLK